MVFRTGRITPGRMMDKYVKFFAINVSKKTGIKKRNYEEHNALHNP